MKAKTPHAAGTGSAMSPEMRGRVALLDARAVANLRKLAAANADTGILWMFNGPDTLVERGALTDAGRVFVETIEGLDRLTWDCECGEVNPGIEQRKFCRQCFRRGVR